ncbi:hypothetical protein TEA_020560 [Camellia sinensis var. sinensis]|uniref:Uncharacterized protein n=1 Tax=Camellia sinensis var. sinensis TaxID=542762 RepID=A0A4S4ECW4_CAMSN|nr:hypothetical protein TEA_020560 [Camellia sinensis var. sinensis]
MAIVDITSVMFPVPAQPPLLPSKTTTAITTTTAIAAFKTSCRTPFSTVAPPLFLAASRLQIRITLETIYEEEEEETVGEFIETTSNAYSAFLGLGWMSLSTIFNKSESAYSSLLSLCALPIVPYWVWVDETEKMCAAGLLMCLGRLQFGGVLSPVGVCLFVLFWAIAVYIVVADSVWWSSIAPRMMDGSAMLTLIYVGGCSIGQPYYVSCSGLNWLLVCMSAAGCCGAQALFCWLSSFPGALLMLAALML